jgi:hypothetical protein
MLSQPGGHQPAVYRLIIAGVDLMWIFGHVTEVETTTFVLLFGLGLIIGFAGGFGLGRLLRLQARRIEANAERDE